MNTYSITVIVDGFDLDSEYQNAGLECLNYGAVVSRSAGVTRIDAELDAPGPIEAVAQLTGDLRSINVTVIRLDPGLVSVSDIADRAGVSRETARLWATGQRRSDFPRPYSSVGSTLVWCWSDVAEWARRTAVPVDGGLPISTLTIEAFNGALAQVRALPGEGWLQPNFAPIAHIGQRRGRSQTARIWREVEELPA